MIALNPNACTGCGSCVKVCPHRVLALNNKKARLAFEALCIECGACQLNCQNSAIEVTKGSGCLFTIIKEDILKLEPGAGEYG
jgi:NAD-dependent dihydropyrimidine dehydrogenase PreA subunit